jgi:hypothetical protein
MPITAGCSIPLGQRRSRASLPNLRAVTTRWHIGAAALPRLSGEKIDEKSLAERFA